MTATGLATRMNKLGISFPFMVAPMVGLSHAAFRELIRSYCPPSLQPLIFSEMLSTRRIPSERVDRCDELAMAPGDRHALVLQLLGNEEHFVERSIDKLLPLMPWGFDINMGCSVRSSLHHEWGIRLMKAPELAVSIARAAKRHSSLPVSVKTRIGLESVDFNAIDRFTGDLEAAGVDWLSIHARASSQKHRGDTNYSVLAELSKRRSIAIIGNGDIQTADDALSLMEKFGLDGAMFGRAATARPWILWQIAYKLGISQTPLGFEQRTPPLCGEEEGVYYFESLLRLIDYLEVHMQDPTKRLRRFRFHVLYSHRWYLFGHDFYSRCMRTHSLEQMREMISQMAGSTVFPSYDRIYL